MVERENSPDLALSYFILFFISYFDRCFFEPGFVGATPLPPSVEIILGAVEYYYPSTKEDGKTA